MIFLSILIFIVALALPSFKQKISTILLIRISAIMLIYAGALSLNALYIQSIGSGIGIYSGLFQVTYITQLLDVFILFISALILTPRPMNYIIGTWASPSNLLTNSNPTGMPHAAPGMELSPPALASLTDTLKINNNN